MLSEVNAASRTPKPVQSKSLHDKAFKSTFIIIICIIPSIKRNEMKRKHFGAISLIKYRMNFNELENRSEFEMILSDNSNRNSCSIRSISSVDSNGEIKSTYKLIITLHGWLYEHSE